MMVASTEAPAQQPADLPDQFTLILEVRLNGALRPLLWQFESLPDGSLATSADRLRQLGFDLAVLGIPPDQPLVRLSDLPGVTYRYITATQSIEIEAADGVLLPGFSLLDTGISLDYTRLRLPRQEIRMASISLSRELFDDLSIWASGYRDFGDKDEYGVFVGLTVPLGNRVTASSSYSRNDRNTTVSARVWRDPDGTEGSWGWALNANEAIRGSARSFRSASVRYIAPFAALEGTVSQFGGAVHATAYAEGSIVAMGGGVFASRRINDSFAVVTGAGPDTPVLSNTRVITRANRSGRALVPALMSLQENAVGIDPSEMPVDLTPARTEAVVVPDDRAGVIVDFGVAQLAAAVVVLVDAAGAPLPVGSVATLDGDVEPAVVGFDGRTFLTGLSARNRVRVRREDAPDCSASFDFTPVPDQQVVIGPVPCE